MDKDQLRDLIRETLREVGLYSEDAVELLMLTAAVETDLGYFIKQNNGPGLGMFSIEPTTHDDTVYRWLLVKTEKRIALRNRILNAFDDVVGAYDPKTLVYNLKYSIVIARLKYYMNPEPIPNLEKDGVVGLARYWKKYYNTEAGDGNINQASAKYVRYAMPIEVEAK